MNMLDSENKETLAAIFASRCKLAKLTLEEALHAAKLDYLGTLAWIKSPSQKQGSFIWFADMFDLDYSVVRKAIREKRA